MSVDFAKGRGSPKLKDFINPSKYIDSYKDFTSLVIP